ncbi:MAG: hypothetical protein LBN08_01460 [Lactobacillales bacterium]|jgi:hypothetical protein|nr:hypothetical protein [Lactobacillales bacterium]
MNNLINSAENAQRRMKLNYLIQGNLFIIGMATMFLNLGNEIIPMIGAYIWVDALFRIVRNIRISRNEEKFKEWRALQFDERLQRIQELGLAIASIIVVTLLSLVMVFAGAAHTYLGMPIIDAQTIATALICIWYAGFWTSKVILNIVY